MRVYRVTVTHWPTDDGNPWPRFIATDSGDPSGAPFVDDLPWFAKHAEADSDAEREFGRHTDTYGGDLDGYVLPRTTRRHWLSRSAAEDWARQARLLGAEVTVEASEPVRWDR